MNMRFGFPLILTGILTFAGSAPDMVRAEGAAVPVIAITIPALEEEGGEIRYFGAGDVLEVVLEIGNDGDSLQLLRRIVMKADEAIILEDGGSDGIDNDFDGVTDEADEAFRINNPWAVIWRIAEEDSALEPGAVSWRKLRFRVAEDAVPGSAGFLSISVGATERLDDISKPRRWRRSFPVHFDAPKIEIVGPDIIDLDAGGEFNISMSLAVPKGVIPEAIVRVGGLGQIELRNAPRLALGNGIVCTGADTAEISDEALQWRLGECVVTDSDRAEINVRLAGKLRDLPADASLEDVASARAFVADVALFDGLARLGSAQYGAQGTGAFVSTRLLSQSDEPAELDTPVEVEIELRNTGDRKYPEFRVALDPNGPFDCARSTLRYSGERLALDPRTCISLDSLKEGLVEQQSARLQMKLFVKKDARLVAGEISPGWLLTRSSSQIALPELLLQFPPHPPARLSVFGATHDEGHLHRRQPGESLTIAAEMDFPRGSYEAVLRVVLRLVDSETGEPLGPAEIAVDRATLQLDGEDGALVLAPTLSKDALWTRVDVPLGLETMGDQATERRGTVRLKTTLADTPETRRGVIFEMTAETVAYGSATTTSLDWVEILIVEPELRVTLTAFDDDRTLALDEGLTLLGTLCNHGNATAYGVVLRLDLPKDGRLRPPKITAGRSWFFARRLDLSQTVDRMPEPQTLYLYGPEVAIPVAVEDASIRARVDDARGLPPRACAALVVDGAIVPPEVRDMEGLHLRFSAEPYRGLRQEGGRVYSGISSPELIFATPVIGFGPRSESISDENRIARHVVTADLPESLGDYRASLNIVSSADVRWQVSRLEGEQALEWENGKSFPAGTPLRLAFEARIPDATPLGWNDTTILELSVRGAKGGANMVKTRLLTLPPTKRNADITTEKSIALDRDCDGELQDETSVDARFEPTKDIAPGECALVRIQFRHQGTRAVERIAIRDVLPAQVKLVEDTILVTRLPSEKSTEAVEVWNAGRETIEWTFEGLFSPKSHGEVSYLVKVENE